MEVQEDLAPAHPNPAGAAAPTGAAAPVRAAQVVGPAAAAAAASRPNRVKIADRDDGARAARVFPLPGAPTARFFFRFVNLVSET